jgi:hypothetical protein
MKNLYSLTLFLLISLVSNAQKAELLLNSYSNDELKEIKSHDPQKYDLLIYAIDHATYLSVFDQEKHGSLNLKELPDLTGLPFFTDLKVKIKDQNQYFYAPQLNRIVVVKSEWVLNHEKNKKQ